MTRVAVIGVGVSGLVSIKTCLEEGLEPVCFERRGHIGGTWFYQEEDRSLGSPCIYQGMLTNVCKEMMSFSDFPFPKDATPYMKGTDVINYYTSYATHFDLLKHIRFNSEVLKVEPTDDYTQSGRWQVTTRDKDGAVTTTVFDLVLLCSGFYTTAFIPDYPGVSKFKGQVIHSCQFRKGSDFKDQTIVVVGAYQSAGDISVLCSDHAKKVYLSMRHGTWVVPRLIQRQPYDAYINKRWICRLPAWLNRLTTKRLFEYLLDYEGMGLQSTQHPCNSSVMVNDSVPIKIMTGEIGVRSGIQRLEGSKVIFDDGSCVDDVDCVIFATGYKHRIPFVDDSILSDDLSKLDLYYHILPPRLPHRTLAVVGYVDAKGGVGPTVELQARWAVRVLKGKVSLPSRDEMLADCERRRNMFYQQYQQYRPRVHVVEYQDRLAKSIGALPNLLTLFLTDPILAFPFFFGPAYPCGYRLVGPHAQSDARTKFLSSHRNLMHGITLSTVRRNATVLRKYNIDSQTICMSLGVICLLLYLILKLCFS